MINHDVKILIVGLGLIGGSYAKALSEQGYKVKAITVNQKDIDYAVERGMIIEGSVQPDERLISEADLVVFALYPTVFVDRKISASFQKRHSYYRRYRRKNTGSCSGTEHAPSRR